jgi:DNA-binding transcriptional ArsR family regulator
MIYSVSVQPDMRYETLCLLERLAVSSGEASSFYSDYNLNCDHYLSELALAEADTTFVEAVRAAYRYVEERHNISPDDLKKNFQLIPETDFSLMGLLLYVDNALSGKTANEAQRVIAMLSALEVFPDDEKAKDAIPKNLLGLSEYLASTGLPAETKWAGIDFCINYAAHRERAFSLLDGAAALLREKTAPLIVVAQSCASRLNALGEAGLDAMLREKGLTLSAGRCDIIPCALRFSAISLYSTELNDIDCVTMHYGVLFDALSLAADEQRSMGDEILRFVKAMNDKNRLQILTKLKDTPLFGQDIVALTGLTAATVSHHMAELTSVGLITIEKQGTRILYRMCRKKMERLITLLKAFV